MADMASWWQRGIVYQVYPRSFQDTNGDGIGDLKGITNRLDYLEWLGVDAIWICPIYHSPMCDFGYDISYYKDINPLFGTLQDFDELVAEAHARGLKVILDYVPNHTSDRHPWFVQSRSSRDNPKRDWYLWYDPGPEGQAPNNWLSHFGGPAWEFDEKTGQYYFHAFLKEQPDLNWRNPEVQQAMFDVLRFWLDRGVDGFRMDVLYQIIKDDKLRDDPPNPNWEPHSGPYNQLLHVYSMDRPEVHGIVADMREVLESYGETVMIAEIWLPVEKLMTYYGVDRSGTHLPLNFQLIELEWDAARIRRAIGEYEMLLPSDGWPNWVLGNHDIHRVASRIGPAQSRVAAMLLLLLRGTPTMYYGDEIAMTDVPIPHDRVQDPFEKNVPGWGLGRDPQRTPMQWDATENAGFTAGEPWLPLAEDYAVHNVEQQRDDPTSVLSLYRELIRLRRAEAALSIGEYVEYTCSGDVVAWFRRHGQRCFLVALNLSHSPAVLDLGTMRLRCILSSDMEPQAGAEVAVALPLSGNQGMLLELIEGEIPIHGSCETGHR